jgi:hypothetical protein
MGFNSAFKGFALSFHYSCKHVEQFPDINKLCNVAYCWIYWNTIRSSPSSPH